MNLRLGEAWRYCVYMSYIEPYVLVKVTSRNECESPRGTKVVEISHELSSFGMEKEGVLTRKLLPWRILRLKPWCKAKWVQRRIVQIEVPGPQECPVTLLNPSFLPLVALPLETAAARPQDALQDGSLPFSLQEAPPTVFPNYLLSSDLFPRNYYFQVILNNYNSQAPKILVLTEFVCWPSPSHCLRVSIPR